MRPMLTARTLGTLGPPEVVALSMDGTYVRIGDALTTADLEQSTAPTSFFPHAQNRVIQHRGRLLWIQRDRVRMLSPAGVWDSIYTMPSHVSSMWMHTGLYNFNKNGRQCIGAAYVDTGADIWVIWSEDGGYTWKRSSQAYTENVAVSNYGGMELFYNNKLFWRSGHQNSLFIDFDHIQAGAFQDSFGANNSYSMGPHCHYNMKIMGPCGANSQGLLSVVYGGADLPFNAVGAGTTGFSADSKWVTWTDGPYWYWFGWYGGAWHLHQLKYNTSLHVGVFAPGITHTNDITSVVVDSRLIDTVNKSWRVIYDPYSRPGVDSSVYLAHLNGETENAPVDFYKFVGPGTALQPVGSAGSAYMALPHNNQQCGGERFYDVGKIDVCMEKSSAGSARGRTKMFFRTFETSLVPSGTMSNVGFLGKVLGFEANLPVSGLISLVNPSVGQISSDGKFIENVPIGSGNLISVEWNGVADGVPNRAPCVVMPFVSGILS